MSNVNYFVDADGSYVNVVAVTGKQVVAEDAEGEVVTYLLGSIDGHATAGDKIYVDSAGNTRLVSQVNLPVPTAAPAVNKPVGAGGSMHQRNNMSDLK